MLRHASCLYLEFDDMPLSDIKVTPAPGASSSPFPMFTGEDMPSVLLECSFLFHDVVSDLFATVRELDPFEIVVVRRGTAYPISLPVDLVFWSRRDGKVVESVADHSSDLSPLLLLENHRTQEELEFYARVCTALHDSLIVLPPETLAAGPQDPELTIDLVTPCEAGTWLRCARGDRWFRVLHPGRTPDDDPMYPLTVLSIKVEGGVTTLSGAEGDLVLSIA